MGYEVVLSLSGFKVCEESPGLQFVLSLDAMISAFGVMDHMIGSLVQ